MVMTGGALVVGMLLPLILFMGLLLSLDSSVKQSRCATSTVGQTLMGPGGGATVGATEYGGPGDPSSGTVGSSGVNLDAHPDSYAELGGTSFATATDLGGLAYGTPLRITWNGHSLIADKEDIGLGGGPIDGRPRVIDLWWQLAAGLGIPYENGLWSGAVKLQHTPATGAANTLGAAPSDSQADTGETGAASDSADPASCDPSAGGGLSVATVAGPRATLAPNGQAEAPAAAPAAVKGIIAAGNQIVGKPYVYGGGHGLPLSEIAPSYDCSSSVSHLLWGGGLLPVDTDMTAAEFETWGLPGPGRWVTLYASGDHVFMYVAGLRWDTHNAAGAGDGTTGIGWHPLVREADGFVARHPAGL
jgi:cell wall-associated NlpC family hydrolase